MNILPKRKRKKKGLFLQLGLCVLLFIHLKVEAKCKKGCGLAMASYYVWEGSNLTYISHIFSQGTTEILRYNPHVPNANSIATGTRINVPFSCECLNSDFLGHTFTYIIQIDDTYSKVARIAFANLTNEYWVQRVNMYDPTQVPDYASINVTVNCTCGDGYVSNLYGLFATYPLRPGQNLSSVAAESGVPPELLERFNPGTDFSAASGLVFVPAKGLYLFLDPMDTYNLA